MGNTFSQGNFSLAPFVSEEVEASVNQILHAFNHELAFQSKHQSNQSESEALPSTSHHQETTRHPRHDHRSHRSRRSRSLDQPDLSDQHNRISQTKLSVIQRQWQCQLCYKKNETDAQICSECGSNKINVYIPIMGHMDATSKKTEQRHKSLLSPPDSLIR